MAKRKAHTKVKRRGRSLRIAAPHDGPTPETVRKLRHDVIGRLAGQGRLTPEQYRAAEEIRAVWEAVGRGMMPSSMAGRLAQRAERRSRPSRDFIDRMGAGEYRAWRGRYVPWARDEAVEILAGAGGTTRLQLTIDIVVDNLGLRQAERQYRIARHGAAFAHLSAALGRYAESAGWVEIGDQADAAARSEHATDGPETHFSPASEVSILTASVK